MPNGKCVEHGVGPRHRLGQMVIEKVFQQKDLLPNAQRQHEVRVRIVIMQKDILRSFVTLVARFLFAVQTAS